MDNGQLTDASAQYREFFEQSIKPVMKAAETSALAYYSGDQVELDEAHAEIDYAYGDYERRLLGKRTAGLNEALHWESSGDRRLRALAVKALS